MPEVLPAGVTVKIGHATTLPGQKMVVVPRKLQMEYAEPRIPTYNQSPHMTEALGGSVADPEWTAASEYPSFPKINTDSHFGLWKPWSCHSAPEWIMEQTIDKESILKKKQREKREKLPVHYPGFTGEVNPWTVSKDSPEFIRGHMERYEPRSILGKDEAQTVGSGKHRSLTAKDSLDGERWTSILSAHAAPNQIRSALPVCRSPPTRSIDVVQRADCAWGPPAPAALVQGRTPVGQWER